MSQTNLILRHLPRYPAHITGANGFQVTVEGGINLVVSPDYGSLVPVPGATNPSMTFIMAWDRSINYYQSISFQDFADNLADQVLEGTLVALRNVTFSANQGVYFSDANTAHAYDLSLFVRGISSSADAAAFKAALALQNVSNTADADKPISTATQTALDAKVGANSPTLTGDPKAPTPAARDSDTSIATTAFVQREMSDYVRGLTLSNNGGNPNTHINIAAGSAKLGTLVVANSATLTKRLNATWAAGNNNGGLDTGSSSPGATYHIFSLRRQSDGAFDAVFTLSASGPNMALLGGYDVVQLIGSILVDGSGNIRPFIHTWNDFFFDSPQTSLPNDLSTGSTRAKSLLSCTIPTGRRYRATFAVLASTNTGDGGQGVTIADGLNSNAEKSVSIYISANLKSVSQTVEQYTNTSGQVSVAVSSTSSPNPTTIKTLGWTDYQIPRDG